MENQSEFNLNKFQSKVLEEFLTQKASYGLKGFYETDSKEFESKFEEEVEEDRKELGFMQNQLLSGLVCGLVRLFNFLGKKSDRNLNKKEYGSAVKNATEILENKKHFKFIEKQLQEHINDELFQELLQIKIVKAVTKLVEKPNFESQPNAKTFGYLALLIYSRNTDSINKDELAEFQDKVYRSFLTFKRLKQNAENYERTGFSSEKHAKKYKQKSLAGKVFYNVVTYLSIKFGEFIRKMSKDSDSMDKVEEILENSKIKKLLCSKLDNEVSEDYFEEELEAETVQIVTQTLLNEDLQVSFEIEKDERLFMLIVKAILDKGIANFCSVSN